jgi:hypothetical protein
LLHLLEHGGGVLFLSKKGAEIKKTAECKRGFSDI